MDDDWYEPRYYAHFDQPPRAEYAIEKAKDPKFVANYSFWPEIIRSQKISKLSQVDGIIEGVRKVRPICYVAHLDAAIQSYYSHILAQKLEALYATSLFGNSVLAYRSIPDIAGGNKGKCNVHFANEAFSEIIASSSVGVDVIAMDVSGFFDNMKPQILKQQWRQLLGGKLPDDHYRVFRAVTQDRAITLNSLRKVLKRQVARSIGRTGQQRICTPQEFRKAVRPNLDFRYQIVHSMKNKYRNNKEPLPSSPNGIPQGSPISSTLANLYMKSFDEQSYALLSSLGGSFRRYSDDILLITPAGLGLSTEKSISTLLKSFGLNAHPGKTSRHRVYSCQVRSLSDCGIIGAKSVVQYLGFVLSSGFEIRLRDGTVDSFKIKCLKAIKRAKLASCKNRDVRLRRKRIYSKLTSLTFIERDERDKKNKTTFHDYLNLAVRVTQSQHIKRQSRQLEQFLHRELSDADNQILNCHLTNGGSCKGICPLVHMVT